MKNMVTRSGDTVSWQPVGDHTRPDARDAVGRLEASIAARGNMSNYLLIDASDGGDVDARARLEYVRYLKQRPFDAVAVYGTNRITRTIALVIVKLGRFSTIEFARDRRTAAEWLTQQGATDADLTATSAPGQADLDRAG